MHRGFFRAYQTVAPRLHETLRQFWRESPAVFAPAGRGAELIFVGELTVYYAQGYWCIAATVCFHIIRNLETMHD